MKKGFYTVIYTENNIVCSKRCYYLTGEKKGNKWIELIDCDSSGIYVRENPEWWALNWMCLPKGDELETDEIKTVIYTEENPTGITFKLKK